MLIVALSKDYCYIHVTLHNFKVNMRKLVVGLLIGFILILAITESNLYDYVLAFILIGAIPGTPYSVSASTMLIILSTCIWIILVQFLYTIINHNVKSKRQNKKEAIRSGLPRRRYKSI